MVFHFDLSWLFVQIIAFISNDQNSHKAIDTYELKYPQPLKLAAIDIGSNAIRMQITHVLNFKGTITFKKIEYIRFPLRLGHDVFNRGKISTKNEDKFIRLMNAFKMLIDLYEVDDHYACATSAMRESANGMEIVEKVLVNCGLKIHVIDGELEADLINKSLKSLIDTKSYLHIDVGGGSTEFNLFVNREKVVSKSFKLGSVRSLEKTDNPEVWKEMQQWLKENIKNEYGAITAIGTGGNIFKAFELAKRKPGGKITSRQIREVQLHISNLSMEERINVLFLNPDRADVIVPALDIYAKAMDWAKATSMIVPDTGLKEGLMYYLYEKAKQ